MDQLRIIIEGLGADEAAIALLQCRGFGGWRTMALAQGEKITETVHISSISCGNQLAAAQFVNWWESWSEGRNGKPIHHAMVIGPDGKRRLLKDLSRFDWKNLLSAWFG